MLGYLVTSRTRRQLLELLWVDGVAASASELARLAGVAYAGAYRELKNMAAARVAVVARSSGDEIYRANVDHRHAAALRTLLEPAALTKAGESVDSDVVAERLVSRSLPVFSSDPGLPSSEESTDLPLEGLLLAAVEIARRDATVARALPAFIARHKDQLDLPRLRRLAKSSETKHRVGFFLDLTGNLTGDAKLCAVAQQFADRRRKVPREFFVNDASSSYSRKLAEKRTPQIARRWGWLMNMGEDAFLQTLNKFRDHASV